MTLPYSAVEMLQHFTETSIQISYSWCDEGRLEIWRHPKAGPFLCNVRVDRPSQGKCVARVNILSRNRAQRNRCWPEHSSGKPSSLSVLADDDATADSMHTHKIVIDAHVSTRSVPNSEDLEKWRKLQFVCIYIYIYILTFINIFIARRERMKCMM